MNVNRKQIHFSYSFCFFLIITVLISFFVCYLSGIDGHFSQKSDWLKHNAILSDMIHYSWPVRYEVNGEHCVLSYYIGFYIIPAMFGKLFGFNVASSAMLVLSVLGLVLVTVILYRHFSCEKPVFLVLILSVLLLSSTFSNSVAGLYRYISSDAGDIIHWISNNTRVQYSSAITCICWVTPQFVPTLLSLVLILENRRHYSLWALIAVPLILFSTFTFLGLAVILCLTWVMDFLSENKMRMIKQSFRFELYSTIVWGGVLMLYIFANIFQTKPVSAEMGFSIQNWHGAKKLLALFLFEFSWSLWLLILGKTCFAKNKLLISSAILLFVLPFFKMGANNDLCMRASIPALAVLNFNVCGSLVNALEKRDFQYAKLLSIFILLAGLPNLSEYKEAVIERNHALQRNYAVPKDNYLFSDDLHKFQYFAWEPNTIVDFLMKEQKK